MMHERKKHTLAVVSEQFRAEIILTDPDGERVVWHEGPYSRPHMAKARITFWKNLYARSAHREGWSVDGEVQTSSMHWRTF